MKRTAISEFANLRSNGLICFDIEDNDALKWVAHTTGNDEIVLVTRKGMSISFKEEGRSDTRAAPPAACVASGCRRPRKIR